MNIALFIKYSRHIHSNKLRITRNDKKNQSLSSTPQIDPCNYTAIDIIPDLRK